MVVSPIALILQRRSDGLHKVEEHHILSHEQQEVLEEPSATPPVVREAVFIPVARDSTDPSEMEESPSLMVPKVVKANPERSVALVVVVRVEATGAKVVVAVILVVAVAIKVLRGMVAEEGDPIIPAAIQVMSQEPTVATDMLSLTSSSKICILQRSKGNKK